MKRFLVTGGAGFIGGHLVCHLNRQGHQVVVLDDLSSGLRSNLDGTKADLLVGSVLDRVLLEEAVEGCDGIYHLAALVAVQDTVERWQYGHDVNLTGTINVFRAVRASGIPVVYASSAAIYGNQSGYVCREDKTVPMPISPYGADKLAAEHQALAFNRIHGIPSFGLRLFNVYGPRQKAESPYSGVISRFMRNVSEGTVHTVHGDGYQTRDFIHVADVVTGLCRAMDRSSGPAQAHVSNMCTGTTHTLLDVIGMLDDLRPGSGANVVFGPGRTGDVSRSEGCCERMRRILEMTPAIALYDGLCDMLDNTGKARMEVEANL